jgi:hypothetical protein
MHCLTITHNQPMVSKEEEEVNFLIKFCLELLRKRLLFVITVADFVT